MLTNRTILFAGTTSSGSSALFDYFRCFSNTIGFEPEMTAIWRKNLYPQWSKENFKNPDKYSFLLNKGIDEVILKSSYTDLKEKCLLLNNVISCLTLPGISLLTNTTVFCVLRDPRSTWLRRREICLEQGYKISVSQFIKEYSAQRSLFKKHLRDLRVYLPIIHVVNFEDFILDKEYKKQLVELAGFNILNYPLNPEYAPFPKEESILWHHSYENQDEIKLIKKQLGEYCHASV